MSALLLLQVSASWASWKLLRGRRGRPSGGDAEDRAYGARGDDDDADPWSPPLVGSDGALLDAPRDVRGDDAEARWPVDDDGVTAGMSLLKRLGIEDLEDNRQEARKEADLRAKRSALKLWCVIASLRLYEAVGEPVLRFIPGYGLLKSTICLYLSWAQASSLADAFYQEVLVPVFASFDRFWRRARSFLAHSALEALSVVQQETWIAKLANMSDADIEWWRVVLTDELDRARGSTTRSSKRMTLTGPRESRPRRPGT